MIVLALSLAAVLVLFAGRLLLLFDDAQLSESSKFELVWACGV